MSKTSNFMNKFTHFLEQKLMPIAGRVADQKHIQAIRDGIILTLPLVIVGSIFLVIAFLPFNGYEEFLKAHGIQEKLLYPVSVTFDLIGVVACIGIAYKLSEKYHLDSLVISIIALSAFLLLTPFNLQTQSGEMVGGVIPLALMGSKGLFVGMITAISVTEIYRIIINKNLVIRLPEGVPPAVSKSFSALIPTFIILSIFLILKILFQMTPFDNAHKIVEMLLVTPLTKAGDTYWGVLLIVLTIHLLWITGLHGSAIVMGIASPVLTRLMDQNRLLLENGEEMVHVVTPQFFDNFVNLGGAGCTLALAYLLMFHSKSEQLKSIGKVSILPGFFNINEPITFGLPIVMNPIMVIPYLLAPLTVATITYFTMKFGIVPKTAGIAVPWTMPPVISGFLTTRSFSASLLQIMNIILAGLIYFPFFKAWDKKRYEEEYENKNISN